MSKRKYFWTQEDLKRNQIIVEFGEDEQPVVKQSYQIGEKDCSNRYNEVRPVYKIVSRPKYGMSKTNLNVSVKIDGKYVNIPLSNIV